MNGRSRRLLVIALGLLGGCSSEPAAPSAAVLDLRLTTPAEDDGAVLLTVSGGPVDSVEASGFRLHWTRIDANTSRIIVLGNLRSGRLARIHIADQRRTSQYSALVNQVAASRTYIQRDPAAYTLSLTR